MNIICHTWLLYFAGLWYLGERRQNQPRFTRTQF